mmetsp:Transcript_93397/g.145758  ORF Transcript_93397/g.145758 Transcript_93397/m.145758 type:complete len:630 (+) Transcript_93397:66-1955(+)
MANQSNSFALQGAGSSSCVLQSTVPCVRPSLSPSPSVEQLRRTVGLMSLGSALANPSPTSNPRSTVVPSLGIDMMASRMKLSPPREPSPPASMMSMSRAPSIAGIMPASSTSARSSSPVPVPRSLALPIGTSTASAPNSVRVLPFNVPSRLHRDASGTLSCPQLSSSPGVDPFAWQRAVAAAADSAVGDGLALDVISAMVSRLDDSDELVRIWAADVITEVASRVRGRRGGQPLRPAIDPVPMRRPPSAASLEAPVAMQMPVRLQSSSLLAPHASVLTPSVVSRQPSVARLVSAPVRSPNASLTAPPTVVAAPAAAKPSVLSSEGASADVWRLPLPQPIVAMQSPETWRSRSTVEEASSADTGRLGLQACSTDIDPSHALFKKLHAEVSTFSAPLTDLATKLQALARDVSGSQVILKNPDIVRDTNLHLASQHEAISSMRSALLLPSSRGEFRSWENDFSNIGKPPPMSTRSGLTEPLSRAESTDGRPSARGTEKAWQLPVSRTPEVSPLDHDTEVYTSSSQHMPNLWAGVQCSDQMLITPQKDSTSFIEAADQATSTENMKRRSRGQSLTSQGVRSSPRRRSMESDRRTSSIAEVDIAGRWKLAGEWIPPGKSVSTKKKPSRMQSSYF